MDFTHDEFKARITRLRREMESRQLDAVLLDDGEAMTYFTGYEVSVSFYRAAFVTKDGNAFFVLRQLDVAPARESSWIDDIVGYPDWEPAAGAIAKAVHNRGLANARIGIDLGSHSLTVAMNTALRQAMPKVQFIDIDGLPWRMRKVKSSAEIEKLRAASAIADTAIQAIIAAARPGFTERQAAAMAAEAFVRLGGTPGLLGIITAGKGWDFLHSKIHDRPLEAGDVLHLEICPRMSGYSARMMRDVVIGPMPDHLQKASDTLRTLQDRQLQALKPGAVASDVDRILRHGLLESGLRDSYDNITGYNLGFYSDYMIRGSDFTFCFHPKADWRVEAGMVLHMYTSAAGISLSDTVLVGEHGPECLTKTDRRLFSTAAAIRAAPARVPAQ